MSSKNLRFKSINCKKIRSYENTSQPFYFELNTIKNYFGGSGECEEDSKRVRWGLS